MACPPSVSSSSPLAAPPLMLRKAGLERDRRRGPHRQPRNARRARQDPASPRARRVCWRGATTKATRPTSPRRHSLKTDRSGRGQPLSLRSHGRAAGRHPRGGHREDRHRWPVDDPLGGEEPRLRRRWWSTRTTTRRFSWSCASRRRSPRGDAPQDAGTEGLRAQRRATTPRSTPTSRVSEAQGDDRSLSAATLGRARPARRRCATARTRTRTGRALRKLLR